MANENCDQCGRKTVPQPDNVDGDDPSPEAPVVVYVHGAKTIICYACWWAAVGRNEKFPGDD